MLVRVQKKKKNHTCGKDYLWNSSACSCENGGYLESIIANSILLPITVSCSVTMNAANTASINSDGETIRYKMDCYILHKILLVVILLFIIVIICYH